jgi:hypothetical protein
MTSLIAIVTICATLVQVELPVRSLVVNNLAGGEGASASLTTGARESRGVTDDLCLGGLHIPSSSLGVDSGCGQLRTKVEGALGRKSSQVDGLGRYLPSHHHGATGVEGKLSMSKSVLVH